ncbi:MAG: cation transporter [Burkholderiales bacterium]
MKVGKAGRARVVSAADAEHAGEHARHGHESHAGHGHSHFQVGTETDSRRLTIALVLIAGFMAAEVVVGITAHSLALLSDAAHMLTDAGALVMSLIVIRLVRRPAGGNEPPVRAARLARVSTRPPPPPYSPSGCGSARQGSARGRRRGCERYHGEFAETSDTNALFCCREVEGRALVLSRPRYSADEYRHRYPAHRSRAQYECVRLAPFRDRTVLSPCATSFRIGSVRSSSSARLIRVLSGDSSFSRRFG